MQWNRKHFQTIDSTNTWAKAHLDSFLPKEMTVVSADYQTAGRGRFKRAWLAPPDANLLVSFCFFQPLDSPSIGNIPQVLALSVCRLLPQIPIRLKWPNDLLVHSKKMGGILCETVRMEKCIGIVLGIGLNVNMSMEELVKVDIPATSLFIETGSLWDREKLLDDFIRMFCEDLERFDREGIAPFLNIYRRYLEVSPKITVQDGARLIKGDFHSIDEQGGLVLRLPDDSLKTVYTGEIVPERNGEGNALEL